MGTSKRFATLYDRYVQHGEILAAARLGPLQSLTDREVDRSEQPMTLYSGQKKVRAWVRFGPESVRVQAMLVRSTPLSRPASNPSALLGIPRCSGAYRGGMEMLWFTLAFLAFFSVLVVRVKRRNRR